MESNYHTHSTFCDGADSPEELVIEAIRLGCPEIGFSGHSYLKEDRGDKGILRRDPPSAGSVQRSHCRSPRH